MSLAMSTIARTVRNVRILQNTKCIHSSATHRGMQRIMKKFLGSSSKKKFHYKEDATLPMPVTFSKGSFEGKSSGSKRAAVLNKLFMRQITDLITTGACASEFAAYGIEINKVQITPDYKLLNVYWLAKGTENDLIIENILSVNSGLLRHELSQLKVMGMVPKIKFIKDKQYGLIMEVAVRLSKADFGDDYKPIEPAAVLKTQLELNTRIEPQIKAKLLELDKEIANEQDEMEEVIPPMAHNIFGLNHNEIMEQVKRSMKRSCATHRLDPAEEDIAMPKSYNSNPVEYPNAKTQRAAFKQFLAKRQYLRNKSQKGDKNYRPELNYLQEEWETIREENLKSYKFEHFLDESDFIEEDENVKEPQGHL